MQLGKLYLSRLSSGLFLFSPFSPFLFAHLFSWLSSFDIYHQTHKDSSASMSLIYAHHLIYSLPFV